MDDVDTLIVDVDDDRHEETVEADRGRAGGTAVCYISNADNTIQPVNGGLIGW